MTYDERLEAAARTAAAIGMGEVDAMRRVPPCDREAFRLAAVRIASRCGIRVRIETDAHLTSAVFYRDGRRR